MGAAREESWILRTASPALHLRAIRCHGSRLIVGANDGLMTKLAGPCRTSMQRAEKTGILRAAATRENDKTRRFEFKKQHRTSENGKRTVLDDFIC
jgi:hypothetical protein